MRLRRLLLYMEGVCQMYKATFVSDLFLCCHLQSEHSLQSLQNVLALLRSQSYAKFESQNAADNISFA